MSSLIESLALLIAIVGLAVASQASLVDGEPSDNTPGSLSELGDLDSLDWVKVLRSECNALCAPDKAFELLKELDKIYAGLDDDVKINRNEQKIVEQFAINQISSDQFCARENLEQLTGLSACYHRNFKLKPNPVGDFLIERVDNFAFLCRSYVLKNLDKRVDEMNETYRHDMEQTLGNKLVLLAESNEDLIEFVEKHNMFSAKRKVVKKVSAKGLGILLEFLKEKSGNNLDAKCYITKGYEGRDKFDQLFKESVVDMCWRWINATKEAETFRHHDQRQVEDYTEKQASWIKYADVCREIISNRIMLAESLYIKMGGKISEVPTLKSVKITDFRTLYKMAHDPELMIDLQRKYIRK